MDHEIERINCISTPDQMGKIQYFVGKHKLFFLSNPTFYECHVRYDIGGSAKNMLAFDQDYNDYYKEINKKRSATTKLVKKLEPWYKRLWKKLWH